MSWLWSWWSTPTTTHAPVAVGGNTADQLTEQQLNALHAEWIRVQERNRADSDAVLAKLVDENNELRNKLESTQRDLKDVRAGRKEDEAELRLMRSELQSLTAEKSRLCVAIFDLEEDFPSPSMLAASDPGKAVYSGISLKMAEFVRNFALKTSDCSWTCLVFIFWRHNPTFIQRCLANGFFESAAHFDAFLANLNKADPLLSLCVLDDRIDLVRQRQRAYALAFARIASCKCLLLGRWALDLQLLDLLAPLHAGPVKSLDRKLIFVEPMAGAHVLPQIRQRGLRFVRMTGVLRAYPLPISDHLAAPPQINFNKPFWQQTPPICLDFYLDAKRCLDEKCQFSHAYRLHPEIIESLRYEVSRQPCPLLAAGHPCLDGATGCHFAHLCTRDTHCSRIGCRFPAWMHSQPEKVFATTQAPSPAAIKSGAKGTAGLRMPLLTQLPTKAPASPARHSTKPGSPFAHPLSIASPPVAPDAAGPANVAAATTNLAETDVVNLTDKELAQLLARAKQEELEYKRGLAEDPFVKKG
ncbi:hypothetical protein JCM10908_001192 [Rhodotorula pacifica]|uniref:uncharacterized protein n=1 Tax=Rhodotorula pacifica TaxID=1495444 RepID=UPI0031797FBF